MNDLNNLLLENNTVDAGEAFSTSPVIPVSVFDQLPALLKNTCAVFHNQRDKDVFLTGAITILSGCMPNITGTYNRQTVYANLFSFIIAPPASGKGSLSYARMLAADFDEKLITSSKAKQEEYKQELRSYKAAGRENPAGNSHGEAPQPPKFRSLYTPADASSTAIFEHLEQNNGMALICETEADTMANSLRQEWGSYSDMLRKAFHHETISRRRKGPENIFQIAIPRISVALSGTPSQVISLIKSTEDGLFSRFIFYTFQSEPVWFDVSPAGGPNLTEVFQAYSETVTEMIFFLAEYPASFTLSSDQWYRLNNAFSIWLPKLFIRDGEDTASSVKRLGLICFRIAMILSAVERFNDGVIDPEMICEDHIFDAAFALTETYMEHMLLMHSSLSRKQVRNIPHTMNAFFKALPKTDVFQRKDALVIGTRLKLAPRTVDHYLKKLVTLNLLTIIRTGYYKKVTE
jgi:hypothetical protein